MRDPRVLVRAVAGDLLVLPVDVAGVLGRDLDLACDVRIVDAWPGAGQLHQFLVAHVRAAK